MCILSSSKPLVHSPHTYTRSLFYVKFTLCCRVNLLTPEEETYLNYLHYNYLQIVDLKVHINDYLQPTIKVNVITHSTFTLYITFIYSFEANKNFLDSLKKRLDPLSKVCNLLIKESEKTINVTFLIYALVKGARGWGGGESASELESNDVRDGRLKFGDLIDPDIHV